MSDHVQETRGWLSPVPQGSVASGPYDTSQFEADAPDFGAIPRDKTGGRATAVLALYESDLSNRPAVQCLDWVATEIGLPRKLRRFALSLAEAAETDRVKLDSRLSKFSHRRTMDQVAPVVRNILRVAAVEFDLYPNTSSAVVISEAVKLAQMFETQATGKFVNGVLGALARDAEASKRAS